MVKHKARFLILLFSFSLFLTSCTGTSVSENLPDSPYPVPSTVKSEKLEGKRILIVGDSITTYSCLGGAIIEKFSECNVETVDVSGTTYTMIGSEHKQLYGNDETLYENCYKNYFFQQLKNAGNLNDYDIVFIQGVINDRNSGLPLTDFEMGVRKTLYYLKENFDGRVIVSLPPLFYYEEFERYYGIPTTFFSTVNDYRKIIHQYAAYYGFELLNSTYDPHFREFNSWENYIDGLHPNENGQKLFAKALHEIMKE